MSLTKVSYSMITGTPINVMDWGADNTGANDSATAIQNAYNSIATTGGALYFPTGNYKINSQISMTGSGYISLIGDGPFVSTIKVNFVAGDAIVVNGPGEFSMNQIGVVTLVNKTVGTYNLHVSNCEKPMVTSVFMNSGTGGLFMFETCNFLQMVNCQGDSSNGTAGSTCLRIKGSGGTISNCYFRVGPFTSGGYTNCKPCLWITGQTTSLQISNSAFTGGGPELVYNISSITSTSTTFTVNTSAAQSFHAGDFIAIRGASIAAYNQAFRVTSVGTTSVTVTSTLNPGTATAQGTLESLTACALVTNADGAVNESRISNCLFEAGQPNLYGTVGLYVNGRQGAAAIQGWNINANYFDFGTVGVMLHGGGYYATTSASQNVFAYAITGCKFESTRSAVHIEAVQGVTVTGLVGNSNQSPTTDYIAVDSIGGARSAGIYIAAGDANVPTQGVAISNSNIGMVANFSNNFLARSMYFGVMLAGKGSTSLQDITIVGNNVFGTGYAFGDDGTVYGNRWNIKENNSSSTTIGANQIVSVASATTLNAYPYQDVNYVTGNTTIQNINPTWQGSRLSLIFNQALTITTGGNISIGTPKSVAAGQVVTAIYDGSYWYLS